MSTVNTSLSLSDALAAGPVELSRVRQFIGGHFVSPAECLAMREWLGDCAVELCRTSEDMEDNISRLGAATDAQVVRWVGRTYAGGIAGFLGDGPEDLSPVVEAEQLAEPDDGEAWVWYAASA
jgi:hypothetical protein